MYGAASASSRSLDHTVVSCQKGDIRQTPDGLKIYGRDRTTGDSVAGGNRGREAEVEELYDAVVHKPPGVPWRPLGRGDAGSLLGDAGIGEAAQRDFSIASGAESGVGIVKCKKDDGCSKEREDR